jgi:hypothetical protein
MYPIIRIALRQVSPEYAEAVLDTFDGQPQRERFFRLPLEKAEIRQRLDEIEGAIVAGHSPAVEELGVTLYQTLFPPGDFRQALNRALEKGARARTEVHLQLVFDLQEDALLHSYPWELMRDPIGYLHAGRRVALSRRLSSDSPTVMLPVEDKLRVLVVSPRILSEQCEAISTALGRSVDATRIEMEAPAVSTYQELCDYLTMHQDEEAPHVLHFDGHGRYGRRCPRCQMVYPLHRETCDKCQRTLTRVAPTGYLEFYTPAGAADLVTAEAFANQLMRSGIRLAVLSACNSAVTDGYSVLSGLAQQMLVAAGIPAVVAMQFSIPVSDAHQFIRQFYLSLAQFDPLSEAVARGRAAVFDAGTWFLPVLFLRSKGDTDQLFVGKVLAERLPRAHKALRGRDAHILALTQTLLDPDVGGALIHGMGGSGKTVLAAEIALREAWRFRGGVIWTEVRQKGVDDILVQIAGQIDGLTLAQQAPVETRVRQVLEALRRQRYLLVVDGLEAALDGEATPEVVRFLERVARRTRLLTTSRESIQMDGVDEYPLPDISPDAAQALFWDHAGRECRAEGGAGQRVERIVVELLERHPLAIEIAARLTRRSDTTLARLERQLERERIALLNDPSWVSRPERQRNVFASFELSYQTLERKERTALSQLAALVNPWTEETGRALTGLSKETWREVKNGLQDAALLRWRESSYSLHALVREFAYDHLSDRVRVHRRAANHLASDPSPILRAEAHYHAIQAQDPTRARDILFDVYEALREMSQYRQLYEMVEETLNQLGTDDTRLRLNQAELLRALGKVNKADAILKWLLSNHDLSPAYRAIALNERARLLKERDLPGDREQAIEVHSRCLELCESLERTRDLKPSSRRWVQSKRANALHDLGMLFHYYRRSTADLRLAEELYTASATLWGKLTTFPDWDLHQALSFKQLGELKTWLDYPGRNLDQARSLLEQARDMFAARGERRYWADTVFQLAKLERAAGRFARALDQLRECESTYRACGLDREAAIMVKQQGKIWQDRSDGERDVVRAIGLYDRALRHLPTYTDKWSRRSTVKSYYRRGEAALELGRRGAAREDFERALRHALEVGPESRSDHRRIIRTFCALAQIYRHDDDTFSQSIIEQAAGAFERTGYDLDSRSWRAVDCRALLGEEIDWRHHH